MKSLNKKLTIVALLLVGGMLVLSEIFNNNLIFKTGLFFGLAITAIAGYSEWKASRNGKKPKEK